MPQYPDFDQFKLPTDADWTSKILDEIGVTGIKKTEWNPMHGLKVEPFYTAYNFTPHSTKNTFPSSNSLNWKIREKIDINEKLCNELLLHKISLGIDSFEVSLPSNYSLEEWNALTKNIPQEISFHFIHENSNAEYQFYDFISLNSETPYKGSYVIDPIDSWDSEDLNIQIERIRNSLRKDLSGNFSVLSIKTQTYQQKELSIIGQLVVGLSKAAAYAEALADSNLPFLKILKAIEIQFTISESYFFEIAKIRAWKLLWASLMEGYKIYDNYLPPSHCTTKKYESMEDGNMNIVKYTAQAMSAVIGGCDYISILPFDTRLSDQEFAKRISRNIALLLKEEAKFKSEIDFSEGSFYIENITDMLYQTVWKHFLQIEAGGGLLKAMRANSVNIV